MTTTAAGRHAGLSRALRRRGALVLALFAPLWSLVAIAAIASNARGPAQAVAALITVAVAGAALRPDRPSVRERVRVLPAEWHRRVAS